MLDFGDFLDLFGLGEDAGDDNGVFESGGGELGEGVLPSQMGAEGVQVYVDKLRAELADTMVMCGAHSLSDIRRSMLFGF